MKKAKYQLSLGLVCLILGLMLSFQIKSTYSTQSVTTQRQFKDITKELDDLKKQKEELSLRLQDYQKKVDDYEKAAANKNSTAKMMKNEIDQLRFLSGQVDVVGEGITMKITPATDLTTKDTMPISSSDIIDIINELNSAGAEAISINDERYVGRTQIRDISGEIKINDSRFDPTKLITIKAIGDPDILSGVFKMPGSIIQDLQNSLFDVKITPSSNVKILKYNKTLDYKFMKMAGR